MLHLARCEGHERYCGCNLMHCKVLVSFHQQLNGGSTGQHASQRIRTSINRIRGAAADARRNGDRIRASPGLSRREKERRLIALYQQIDIRASLSTFLRRRSRRRVDRQEGTERGSSKPRNQRWIVFFCGAQLSGYASSTAFLIAVKVNDIAQDAPTPRREVKILMRLPDGRNVATRQAVHGSAPCARTKGYTAAANI